MKQEKQHESYGVLSISKFSSNNAQYFGSDLIHNGGVSITISKAVEKIDGHRHDIYGREDIIRVRMSHNQFVDAITSGMNTSGVPCTIEMSNGERLESIPYVTDKREAFQNEMSVTQQQYLDKIDRVIEKLDGNVGKRKADEIRHDLSVLSSHIRSNTNYVMQCFNEAMDKTVTEAKHSVANYIDHKIRSTGIEALREGASIKIDKE